MANAKSLRKRIALVAAAALGVGMLVAAPANAAITAATGTLTVSAASAQTAGAFGASAVPAGSFTAGYTATGATDVVAITAAITTNVTGATSSLVVGAGSSLTNDVGAGAGVVGLVATLSSAGAGAVLATHALTLTTDKAGTYVVTLTPDAAGLAAGMTVKTVSLYASALYAFTGDGLATGNATNSTVNGVAGAANSVTLKVAEQGTTARLVTVSGAGATIASYANGTGSAVGTIATGGASLVVALGVSPLLDTIVVNTPTAGTITASIFDQSAPGIYNATATSIVTITVPSATNTAFSAANSTSFLGGTNIVATVDQVVSAAKGTGTQVANIALSLKNASNTAYTGTDVTATVSGSGLIISNGTATGIGNSKVATVTLTSGVGYVDISGDGTAGVATITTSVGSTVFSTKTVTFTGALATLAATNVNTVNAIGANAGSFTVLAKDAAGNPLSGVNVFATSATPAIATVPAAASVTNSSGVASFTVTGVAAGTSVLTFGELATSPTITTTGTVTVGSSTGTTVTLTFDKATYAPGEKAILTLTVKDANGAAVADGTYASLFTAALTSSVAVGGESLSASASPALVGGVKSWTLYAPVTSGAFSVNGTTGTAGLVVAAQGKAVTGTATVTGSTTGGGLSAADSAAIAAAKAAADAATAAVATLSTTVASLIASITAQIRALAAQIAKLLGKSGGTTPGLPKTGSKK